MYLVDYNFEEFCLCNDFSFEICGVDNENYCISASVIGRPDTSDSLLTSKIPSTKFDVFMTNLLNIAADGGCGLYGFSE